MSFALILGVVVLSLATSLGAAAQDTQSSSTSSTSTAPNASTPAKPQPCPTTSASAPATNTDCKTVGKSKTKSKKHDPPPASGASSGPTKTVVRNGGTTAPEVELSPGLSPQQTSQQTKNTDQLLASANANLKAISDRQLTATQQDTVKQIKSFIEQSKQASNDGDVQRAYNLANKADMLSADLKGK